MSKFRKLLIKPGVTSLIDEADYALICRHKWSVTGAGYVMRNTPNKKPTQLQLHRYLTKAKSTQFVDHVNGNKLDNRRQNLRLATPSQNNWNRGPNKSNPTGFKGVYKNERYCARIVAGGRYLGLGFFKTAEDAARAYDKAAKKLHGKFAYLNFPKEQKCD